jgi:hypothetical protein
MFNFPQLPAEINVMIEEYVRAEIQRDHSKLWAPVHSELIPKLKELKEHTDNGDDIQIIMDLSLEILTGSGAPYHSNHVAIDIYH